MKFGFMGCIKRALFIMKSKQAFKIYLDTFSKLAKQYDSYIVAGR